MGQTKSNHILYKSLKILDIGIAWNYQAQAEEEILESIKFYPNLNPFFKNIAKDDSNSSLDKIRIFVDNLNCFSEGYNLFGIQTVLEIIFVSLPNFTQIKSFELSCARPW